LESDEPSSSANIIISRQYHLPQQAGFQAMEEHKQPNASYYY